MDGGTPREHQPPGLDSREEHAVAPTPEADPAQLVYIGHPDWPEADPAVTSRDAFDKVWAEKGFQILDRDPAGRVLPLPVKGSAVKAEAKAAAAKAGGGN